MNSMSEMHAELEEQKHTMQDAAEKVSILDDFHALDRQMHAIREQFQIIQSKLKKS